MSSRIIIILFLLMIPFVVVAEQNDASSAARSLDAQVQQLKSEVINLNRDLSILEEELMFPSSTQVSVFLSLDIGKFFKLESVKIKIDEKLVSSHIYSEREIQALEKGAVQRLFLGNYKPGKHTLVAVFIGQGPKDREYQRATTHHLEKKTAPVFLELTITDTVNKQQPEFLVKEW